MRATKALSRLATSLYSRTKRSRNTRIVAQRAVQHLERDAQPVVLALGEVHLGLAALADDVHHVVARDRLLLRHRAILPFHRPRTLTRNAEMSLISSAQTECGIGYSFHVTG